MAQADKASAIAAGGHIMSDCNGWKNKEPLVNLWLGDQQDQEEGAIIDAEYIKIWF